MTGRADDSGQWLLLMAVIAAVGMAVLLVFVNQSVMAGYASSGSILDFPKNDIREVRSEVVNEAYVLGTTANEDGADFDDRQALFEVPFDQFTGDLEQMYALKGVNLEVEYDPLDAQPHQGSDMLDEIALHIYYSDGSTTYTENTVVFLQ